MDIMNGYNELCHLVTQVSFYFCYVISEYQER